MMKSLLVLIPVLLLQACTPSPFTGGNGDVRVPAPVATTDRPDLKRFFGDIEGTFVLLDPQSGQVITYNEERAATRYLPASTFKVPNTLIALETGAVSGPETLLVRDTLQAPRENWWPESWTRNHTLQSALPGSVVWYYQEIARRVGAASMRSYLERFNYGNREITGGIDQFWLTGGLRISAEEQVEFLRRFHTGELGVSQRSTDVVKELLVLEETPEYRLSGKTGWAGLGTAGAAQVGWLVGYLERGDEVHYFATNIDLRTPADAAARLSITKSILGELGLLDAPSRELRDIVDAAVRPLIAEYDVPGMAVALTIDGRPHFFNYGVASRESAAPVTRNTLFELGSISKTFTATLATHARAEGKLSLDDRPGRFLPQLRGSPIDRATLLHLGTYTAGGLPLQFPDGVSDDTQMIRYFREWQAEAEAGAQRRYSNPSIGLFGRATALALGSTFADAVESRLLPALGLGHTHVSVPEHAMANYAWGYNASDQPVRVNPGMFDSEAYGIRSSAADLIRFVQLNIDPSPLDPSMRRAVVATHTGHFRIGEMVQGLGWEMYPFPIPLERLLDGNSRTMIMESNPAVAITSSPALTGPVLFNKTGSTNGFGGYVAFVPERRIGIVLLANRNFPIPDRIAAAHAILEQVLRN